MTSVTERYPTIAGEGEECHGGDDDSGDDGDGRSEGQLVRWGEPQRWIMTDDDRRWWMAIDDD